jgi:glycosyltransferase involved in cell wall biosynthesis
MTETPVVSVVVIFLNAERFLREAVESVLGQTYAAWELLLVDDGSTDGSTETAMSYVDRYPGQVRYLEHAGHQNLGMSVSRNLGIRHALGEFIATLDADDVWTPGKLEEQVRILRAHPEVGVTYGRTLNWHSWSGSPTAGEQDTYASLGVEPETIYRPRFLFKRAIEGDITTPSMSGIFFRREVFDRSGGFEEEFRGMFEDQVFVAKVFLAETVYVSGQVWDKYRIHPDSCCSVNMAEGAYARTHYAYLSWLHEYLIARGLKGGVGWYAIQVSLLPYRHPAIAPLYRYLARLQGRVVYFARKTLSMLPLIDRQRTPTSIPE